MYYSSFGLLSLVLHILTNHEIIFKRRDQKFSLAKNAYRYFLFSVILYFITDIAWGLTYEAHLIPLVYIDTSLYFLTMALSVFLWTTFVVKFLNNDNKFSILFKYMGYAIFIFVVLCLIGNLFYPVVFSIGSDGEYNPLPTRLIFLLMIIMHFAFTALYTFITAMKSSGKTRRRHSTVAISGLTMTVFIVLQTLYPFIPFYSVGCLLASTLIRIFLEGELERERNQILSDALKAAESANVAKTIFLSGMSHEIRTPINAIMGMNDIIRQYTDDEQIIDCTDKIQDAGSKLLAMISDILDFSKIGSGKLELLNEDYSLSDLISSLYGMVHLRAEEKGLQVDFDIDPRLPKRLFGDMLKMKQVLNNLLSNAVKFTEKGTVVLRITLLDKEGDFAKIRFLVIDSGIGIKEEDKDKLFQAFSRVDTQRTCTIEGMGIGLITASDILQLMGSQLSVDSTYNVGSTFSFDVIQRIADSSHIGQSWSEEPLQENSLASRDALSFTSPESHILIVDDTELNLKVITGLLKATQIQVDTALSGEECIEKFRSNTYDIVFLDFLMPKMDGIETLKNLKELFPGKTAYTPIISLTASAVTGVREQMLSAGFTDFMTKPVTLPYITNMLLKYLPKSHIHTGEITEQAGSAPETTSDLPEAASVLEEIPKQMFDIPWMNVKEAVEYCGSADVFMGAIEIFTKGIDEKSKLLENCVETNDIELFTITVHALKSSMLTLGIDNLSAKAKELEHHGKQNEVEQIKEKLPDFLEKYRGLKPVLLKAIGEEK